MSNEVSAEVRAVLRKHVRDAQGLHWVLFQPASPGKQSVEEPSMREIGSHLKSYGLPHSPADQLHRWRDLLPKVHAAFENLNQTVPATLGRDSFRAMRLVLDIEVGGVMYAAVGDQGWVLAATLDQQSMNAGSAEQRLIEMVSDLNDALTTADHFTPASR